MRFGLIEKAGNCCVVNGVPPRTAWATTSKNSTWKSPHLAPSLCLRQRTEAGYKAGDPSQMEVVWELLQPDTMLGPCHTTLPRPHHAPRAGHVSSSREGAGTQLSAPLPLTHSSGSSLLVSTPPQRPSRLLANSTACWEAKTRTKVLHQ